MKQASLQPAFVLHSRAYRETSFLIELFTPLYGRLTVIARGMRGRHAGLLQPFIPLLVSWVGKGELMTLSHVEAGGVMTGLQGDALFAGFYLNELLMGLLQKWDSHSDLYTMYQQTLLSLQTPLWEEKVLRLFEKKLLEAIGYGLLPTFSENLHQTYSPDQYYRFVPEQGFVHCEIGDSHDARGMAMVFSGKSLLDMAREDWQDEQSLRDAKRLMRYALSLLLGARPIHSRRLFMQSIVKEECK